MMTIILNLQEDFYYTYLFFSMYTTEPDLSLSVRWVLGIPSGVGDFFFLNYHLSAEKNITDYNWMDCQNFEKYGENQIFLQKQGQ